MSSKKFENPIKKNYYADNRLQKSQNIAIKVLGYTASVVGYIVVGVFQLITDSANEAARKQKK